MTDPTPPSPPIALTTTQAAAPTLGSIIGSALGAYLTSKLAPSDPLLGSALVSVVTGVVTGLFHLVATKLGSLTI